MRATRATGIRRGCAALTGAVLLAAGLIGILPPPPAGAISAPAAGGFTGVNPYRLLDTRQTGKSCGAGGSSERSLQVAGISGIYGVIIPSNAAAVALNVTVVSPNGAGFVTVWPAGLPRPTASSVNYVAGSVVPNNVIVKVGALASVSLYANAGCPDLVVDVVGYFAAGTAAFGGLTGVNPTRLLDTRSGGQGPCVSGARDLQVAGRAFTDIPPEAAAVALNVTVVSPNGSGYLTIYPKGTPPPTASTLNYTAGQVVANGTVVKVGDARSISIFANNGCPHVVVDVVGWFAAGTPIAPGGLAGIRPFRLLDTRASGQTPCLGGARYYTLTVAGVDGSAVPAESRAVALNVTVTNPSNAGFVTVNPSGFIRPNASHLNFTAGQTVPNGVLVKVGNLQAVDIFVNAGCADVIVDVVGAFAAEPLDLAAGCTGPDLLTRACATFVRASIPPANTDIGAVSSAASFSDDGRYVTFAAGSTSQVYWRDQLTGTTRLVSVAGDGSLGDDSSYDPVVSADGRYVAFLSDATNLTASENAGFSTQVYRWDSSTATLLALEDTTNDGMPPNSDVWSPSISDDGNHIMVITDATNLATDVSYTNFGLAGDAVVFTVVPETGYDPVEIATRTPIEITSFGASTAHISGDGRFVIYVTDDPLAQTADLNDAPDVYRRDLVANRTLWITRNPAGGDTAVGATDATISRDGTTIAFTSFSGEWDALESDPALPLTDDVFLRVVPRVALETETLATYPVTRVSERSDGSRFEYPCIATPPCTLGYTSWGGSTLPTVSADGTRVGYLTDATNALAGDTNGIADYVVTTVGANPTTVRGVAAADGSPVTTPAWAPTMTPNGRSVGWVTPDALEPTDTNGGSDAYLRYLWTSPTITSVSPTTLTAGAATQITVQGTGFAPHAIPVVDGPGITVSGVSVNTAGTQLTATLTVAATGATGRHDLWVHLPGGTAWPGGGAASVGRTGLIRVT
ncbi:MAG: IPT/TIG domain-containing protein [Actinomycetes bacterium]